MENFPHVIEFQLHNCCNANCIICPYREIHNEKKYMDDNLFKKIISEVGQKNILLIPYLNNEPFLDAFFYERLRDINQMCPNCEIEISTNLSNITEDMVNKLLDLKITDLRISFLGFEKDTYQRIMPGLNYEESWKRLNMLLDSALREKIQRISITMIEHETIDNREFELMDSFCMEKGIVFNRWGYLDRAGNNSLYKNKCLNGEIVGCEQNRPLERMHIMSNGVVVLCCQDWREEVVLGNLNNNSIIEIWNGEKYNKVRESIYHNNSADIELCKKCKLAIRRKNN